MTNYHTNTSSKAFSLIEVLIFVTILSLFFVAAISVVSVSLRNMKNNEHRILATRYAEELMEWLKAQKEEGWVKLTDNLGTYNFCSSPITEWPQIGACAVAEIIGETIYTRTVIIDQPNSNQISVSIEVTWTESGNTYKVPMNAVFSVWE